MTTLMVEGKRRCDARCHNAKKPKCRCICGGGNHGGGLTATEHMHITEELMEEEERMIKKIIKSKKTFPFYKKAFKVKTKKLKNQMLLFEEEREEPEHKKHNPPG